MREKEPTYNEAQIVERLNQLPGWFYEDGWIRRNYKTDGWPTTLMLVNTIGYLAEAAYHHPDLAVTWGKRAGEALHAQRGRHHGQGLRSGAPNRGPRALASGRGRRADGHPEQVGAQRRPARMSSRPSAVRSPRSTGEEQPAPRAVCDRPSRRAGLAAGARRDAAALRIRGRGAPDHRRGADDHRLDRAQPVEARSAGRHRPRDDSGAVRGRSPADWRQPWACAWKKDRAISASYRDTSAGPPRRTATARGTSRSPPRSTTRRS